MKTATSLLILLVPTLFFAQRSSRCPCMDRKVTTANDFRQVMQEMNEHLPGLNQQLNLAQAMQAISGNFLQTPPVQEAPPVQQVLEPAPVPVVAKEEMQVAAEPLPAAQAVGKTVNAGERRITSVSNANKVKRKRVSKGKLSHRKKIRKYRGGCPVFN